MAIVQHTAGNINDIREYPFADTASLRDDNGSVLPEYVLNDCNLWWPDSYGEIGYVSSVTVSPSLVTIVFSAYNETTLTSTLIAALHFVRTSQTYRSYQLKALKEGVGGWASIGAISESLTTITGWRFSTYANSQLCNRVAQAYSVYPVTSLGKENVPVSLIGEVNFISGSDIDIFADYRYVEGEYTRCIVFSLNSEQLPDLYSYYAGPCGKRPETRTCDQTPIVQINDAVPDANGMITIIIDDTNSVLHGEVDDTDGEPQGIIITSIVEYDDACAPVTQPNPLPADLCESSLIVEYGSSSSSSYIPRVEESSSAVNPYENSVAFDFSDVATSGDFSLFATSLDGSYEHLIDWKDLPDNDPADDFYVVDNSLAVPFARISGSNETTQKLARKLRCNSWTYLLVDDSDYVEIDAYWKMKWEELLNITAYDGVERTEKVIYLSLENEDWRGHLASSTVGIRLRIAYRYVGGDVPIEVRITPQIKRSGVVWKNLPNPYDSGVTWPYLTTLKQDYAESSSYSSSSGTSSSEYVEQHYRLKLYIDPTSSSSAGGDGGAHTHFTYEVEIDHPVISDWKNLVLTGGFMFAAGELENKLRFFGFDVLSKNLFAGTDFSICRAYLRSLVLRGSKLQEQECTDTDFVNGSVTVDYAVQYDPANHWSNDFGTVRAVNQFQYLPTDVGVFTPQYGYVDTNNKLRYPAQYLDATAYGTSHRYAPLKCETSIVDEYLVSVAFKYVSGSPKVGLMLGWQGDADHNFWAVLVDMLGRRIGYGMHTIPHRFVTSWDNAIAPYVDSDWLTSWHRLVARVIYSGGKHVISAWWDPENFGPLLSSSAGYRLKVIPIDYGSPLYSILNIAEWDGSSISQLQYGEGAPGLYVYGGEVRFAEFTVTPLLGSPDIIVPNKCDWLER